MVQKANAIGRLIQRKNDAATANIVFFAGFHFRFFSYGLLNRWIASKYRATVGIHNRYGLYVNDISRSMRFKFDSNILHSVVL